MTVVAHLVALTYALSLGALVEMFGLIWPPAGVAVASLLLALRHWWPALLGTLFVDDQHDAQVVSSRTDGALRAWAGPQHVRQILDNLLQNALRHGRPPVVVDVERVDGWACLTVTNHCRSVPGELVGRLFGVFAQPDIGDRRSSQGLGLGFAIRSELATSNGGSIGYEPDGAVGSVGVRFVVRLPLAAAEVRWR